MRPTSRRTARPQACGRKRGARRSTRAPDRAHEGRVEHQTARRDHAKGRPLRFFMTAGQVSDYTGAAALLGSLPAAEWLIADRGYDADWFRDALKDKGIRPCIPGRKSRGKAVRYDRRRYKRRNRIEIMFGRLKDWRRIATRYDRCPKVFLSAVALAATVLFWL
ncbi:MAG: IS5 family transposase [Fuscovulum sp.]|nr:MAG: IS5 family transposase [Fuscovulum sp.]WRH62805.1 MAG: IS5 family transposase [Fuscovulum sp.]